MKYLILSLTLLVGCATVPAADVKAVLDRVQQGTTKIWVEAPDGGAISTGSGFAISDSLLVTAAHVCEENDRIIQNVIRRGNIKIQMRVARVNRLADLCVLEGMHGLKPLTVRKAPPRKHERTYIYGAALGVPDVATEGFASEPVHMCVNWKATPGPGAFGVLFPTYTCIAKDWRLKLNTPAAPGNSGGPVVDANGRVISVLVMGNRSYNFITYGVHHPALLEILK